MERIPRSVNHAIDEVIRGILRDPPLRNDLSIIEEKVVAEAKRRLEEPYYELEKAAGQAAAWGKHIASRMKAISKATRGRLEFDSEMSTSDLIRRTKQAAASGSEAARRFLTQYEGELFRKYHRVPTGNGYRLKESEQVTVEENRRVKGEYRRRRLENGRLEEYHGDIDSIALILGLGDEDLLGSLLKIRDNGHGALPPAENGL